MSKNFGNSRKNYARTMKVLEKMRRTFEVLEKLCARTMEVLGKNENFLSSRKIMRKNYGSSRKK